MGFTSSIHIGASGVMAHQERMSVISDNIANLNTVGFKSSGMLFNNLISKQLTGADAGNQVGQGVGVSSILPNMSSGALESTNTPTDIAVGGKGFFLVSPDNAKTTYYTRAGNFRLTRTVICAIRKAISSRDTGCPRPPCCTGSRLCPKPEP